MDSNTFINVRIISKLGLEFCHNDEIYSWSEFIKSKDLGIIVFDFNGSPSKYIYEIIDEKKWLIARIKYGI